jgi:Tfp pilus assembly protein PilF
VDQSRDREAIEVLTQLIRLGSLPARVSEEAQLHLANAYLRREEYAQARRHLHVLLVCDPHKSEYHYLMALTFDAAEDGDLDRASHHYERAVELEPNEPTYLHDHGVCLVKCGAVEEGLQALERAVELDPDEIEFLQDLLRFLAEAGEFDRARRAVMHAMFRNPEENRYRRLWDDVRFREAMFHQRRKMHKDALPTRLKPTILPLRKKRSSGAKVAKAHTDDGQIIRLDSAAAIKPPHAPKGKEYRQSN